MADKKLDKVLEGYKPIPMKRMFYPRGMKLSEDFVNAFHREFDRLVGEGVNPKSLVERFGKAMRFHQNETRRYKILDEEKEKSEGQKQREHEEAQSGPNQGERPHWWKDKKEDAKKRKGLEEGRKKKKSRKKGGNYGMGDSHSDSDGGDD